MRGISMRAFLPILLLLLTLYVLFHGVVYFSVITFFNIQSQQIKYLLLLVIVMLGASFFMTSMLAHSMNTRLTRGLYITSATWIGSMIYIAAFFVLAWIIASLVRVTDSPHIMAMIGMVVLIVSAAISFYGFWNAEHPQIKNISISVSNLPDAWKNKKVLFVSDIHLGYIYKEKEAAGLVDRINKERADIVFIGGDLFDGSDGDLMWANQALAQLKASEGVFYITGNHETYLGVDKAIAAVQNTSIHMLRDEKIIIDGMQIVGIDYPDRGQQKDVAAVLKKVGFNPQMPSILLNHAPVQVQEAAQAGVSVQLSGHTHLGQLFPFAFITRMVYKGYDYGLKQITRADGLFSVYTSNGYGTWGPPMRTGNTPEVVVIDFTR